MNEKRRGIEKTSKVKKSASLKAPWVVYVVVRVKTRKLSLCRTGWPPEVAIFIKGSRVGEGVTRENALPKKLGSDRPR